MLTETLIETGDWSAVSSLARDPEDGPLMAQRAQVDAAFGKATLTDMLGALA